MALELASLPGVVSISDYVRAVDRFVRMHTRLIDEPEELLIDPRFAIDQIKERGYFFGDCDDTSLLIASLLTVVGIATRFKAISERADGSFGHVFVEFKHGETWKAIDSTLPFAVIYRGPYLVLEV